QTSIPFRHGEPVTREHNLPLAGRALAEGQRTEITVEIPIPSGGRRGGRRACRSCSGFHFGPYLVFAGNKTLSGVEGEGIKVCAIHRLQPGGLEVLRQPLSRALRAWASCPASFASGVRHPSDLPLQIFLRNRSFK